MPLPKQKDYTIEDIYALPDGKQEELIDGRIYSEAPPSRTHQQIVAELTTIIREHIKKNGGECEAIPSPFAVFLDSLKDKKQKQGRCGKCFLTERFPFLCVYDIMIKRFG